MFDQKESLIEKKEHTSFDSSTAYVGQSYPSQCIFLSLSTPDEKAIIATATSKTKVISV